MNLKSIFNLFSPKGKAQAVAQRHNIATLAMRLGGLSLLALAGCVQAPASVPVVEEFAPQVAPAAVTKNEGSQPDPYDIEGVRAQRYAEAAEERAEAASLAANPELLKAHPPALVEQAPESTFLASNPELMTARRYTNAITNEVDPDRDRGLLDFFAGPNETNGLRAIERDPNEDIGLLEFFKLNNRSPVNFDKEGLQQTYFQDWTIEANAADAVKAAVEPAAITKQNLDFWIEALSRSYNWQARPAHPSPVIYQPVTFDRDRLRQTYFQNWEIEADTADPSPLMRPVNQ